MTRALVLGGGGPVGIAWELGMIAGLADEGFDLAFERIIGTSAGAIVGAQMASGRPPAELLAEHLALPDPEATTTPAPDLMPLVSFMMRRPVDGYPSAALLADVGAYARGSAMVTEADFLAGVGRLVPGTTGWPEQFVCTAVDAVTGAFQVWDRESKIGLTAAVASSCAVPGLYPPITIRERLYVDGGVRSATNSDLAEGFDAVVVLAVTLQPFADFMRAAAARELKPLEAAGSQTILMAPDAVSLTAFGPNLMVASDRGGIAAAGREQGRVEARRIKSLRP